MISTFETIKLFSKIRFNQCLADLVFMIDFVAPGEPVILKKDGSLLAVFEIEGIEYESLEPDEIDEIEKEVRIFSELIKDNITITNYFIRRKGRKLTLSCAAGTLPVVRFLQEKKESFYNSLENETFQSTILCCITLNHPLIKKGSLNYFTGLNREFVFLGQKVFDNLKKIKAIYSMAKTSLKNIRIRELSHEEIFQYFFYIINGDKEVPPYRKDLSLNSQLARSSYSFKKDHYLVDKTLRRVITILDEPPYTERMFFRNFFSYRGEIIVKNSFFTIDYRKFKKESTSNYKISKAILFKKALSEKYVSEYEENESMVEKERRKPFFHHLSILINSEDEEDLNTKSDEIISMICKTGAYADMERGYLSPAAISFFPGQENFNKRKNYILSSNLANLFIKSKLSVGDEMPLEYFLDRNGNFYGFNPFSREDAPHTIISGSTGKGKSYLLIKILLSFLAINSRIIALDKSLEYFFEVLKEIDPENTTILRLDRERIDLQFNPFLAAGNKASEEQMRICERLLEIIIGENITPGNRYLIRESLEQFFEEYGEALKHSDKIKPIDLLVTIIRDKFRDERVENAVKLWLEGDRGKILNSGVDNFTDKKFCLFDLKGIEDREDILRVVTYLVFNRIDKLIIDEQSLSIPKILAIDEAKFYYDKDELAPFLDKYIRQGRKHNLCVVMNFQSINDALLLDKEGNLIEWSKGLFENTQKFILFGRQMKIEHALKALRLSESQRELYETIDTVKREFLLVSRGGVARVLTPVTGPWTNVIATSNPQEREFRERLRGENKGNYIETIKSFVNITAGSLDLEERLKRLGEYFDKKGQADSTGAGK